MPVPASLGRQWGLLLTFLTALVPASFLVFLFLEGRWKQAKFLWKNKFLVIVGMLFFFFWLSYGQNRLVLAGPLSLM